MYRIITTFAFLFLLSPIHAQDDINGNPIRIESGQIDIKDDHQILGTPVITEAGDEIEGDYIGKIAFSSTGEVVYAINRKQGSISVLDWETRSVLYNIPIGTSPSDIAVHDNIAYVPCVFSDALYIIDMQEHEVISIVSTSPNPGTVQISKDGLRAFVGCDSDVCDVFDLSNNNLLFTIPDFQVFISSFSFSSSSTRNAFEYSQFAVAPDHSYVLSGGLGDSLSFYDGETGLKFKSVFIENAYKIRLTGDEKSFLVESFKGDGTIYKIDVLSGEVVDSYELSGNTLNKPYGKGFGMNFEGTKLLVSLSGNKSGMINLETDEMKLFTGFGTSFWLDQSYDYTYAILGGYFLSVISFETENVVSSTFDNRSQFLSAVSPKKHHITASDPLRYEGVYFYQFEDNPEELLLEGRSSTGSELEADASYKVMFTPNGKKIVILNPLSQSVSIINAESKTLEAIVPVLESEIFEGAISMDSKYLFVSMRLLNKIAIIDLDKNELVNTINSFGSRPSSIRIDENNEFGYVMNVGGTDNIARIKLDGENSFVESTFSAGNFGISWTNFGIRSGFLLVPNSEEAIIASSFTNEIFVVDVEQGDILSSIEIDGFPLQIAYASDLKVAAITLKNSNQLAYIDVTGASSELFNYHDIDKNPTNITYDPITQSFVVCSNDLNTVSYFDALEGVELKKDEFITDLVPINVKIDKAGNKYLLLAGSNGVHSQFWINNDLFEFEGTPSQHFDYSEEQKMAAVALLNSDQIVIMETDSILSSISIIETKMDNNYVISGNPVVDFAIFNCSGDFVNGQVSLIIYSQEGKKVKSLHSLNSRSFQVDLADLFTGSYYYQINSNRKIIAVGGFIKE